MRIRFNLRAPKSTSPTPINIIIRYGGLRVVYPSNELIHPKNWDKKKQRVRTLTSFPQNGEFNHRLENLEATIHKAFLRYRNDHNDTFPSAEQLRDLLDVKLERKAPVVAETDLLAYCSKFVEDSVQRLTRSGSPISPNTRKQYKALSNILQEYAIERRLKHIPFSRVDHTFYKDFVKFMKEKRSLKPNSQGSHIKTLKTILNDAKSNEVDINPAYKQFIVAKEDVDSIYLNEGELKELYNLDLSNRPKLERVRDSFLVGCWTGLRFSDFSKINPESIKNNSIQVLTKKDKKHISVPLMKEVRAIMTRYNTPNHLPPPISNQKMNEYLKVICELCPLLHEVYTFEERVDGTDMKVPIKRKKYTLVSSHTARRSFATNMYKKSNNAFLVMKVTGHKELSTFMKYIRLPEIEHSNQLTNLYENDTTLLKVVI